MTPILANCFIDGKTCRKLVFLSVLLLIAEGCQLSTPWLLGKLIDRVIANRPICFFFAWIVSTAILAVILEQAASIMFAQAAWCWKQKLREKLLIAWSLQEPDEGEQWQTGEMGMKFLRDIPILGNTLQAELPQLLKSSFMFLIALIIAFWQCWQMGLVIIFIIPVLLIIHSLFHHKFQHLAQQSRLIQDNACSKVFEFLHAYPELKALEATKHYQLNVADNLSKISDIEYANSNHQMAFQRCFSVLLTIFEYVTLGTTCYLACNKQLPVGQIIFFQVMVMRVLNGGVSVFQIFPNLLTVKEAQKSLSLFLNKAPAISYHEAQKITNNINTIDLKDISFIYPKSKRHILSNYSLHLKKGTVTALSGMNGIGKTTLWKILIGWLKPTKGTVFINDMPLEKIVTDYRSHISIVTQRTLLFYGSLLENITLGEIKFDKKKMDYALCMSGFDKVLERFPEGLAKHIENDAGLSGGECQRLAIARALYRQPELLILDEVTNHMDSSGKNLIKKLLNSLRHKMIIIVISHEPDIQGLCDKEITLP